MGPSSFDFFSGGFPKAIFSTRVRFGRSRSSKVIDLGTKWKRVCDFLLVRDSNLGPILHYFWYIAAFVCSTLILGVFALHQIAHMGFLWVGTLNYSAVILFSKYSNLCDHVVMSCCYFSRRIYHETGSNNPLVINSNSDRIPFHIYFRLNDMLRFIMSIAILLILITLSYLQELLISK